MQEINIQNLKCGGCAATITKKINEMSCVKKVAVNIDLSTVTVELIDTKKLDQVKERLSSLGYPEETETNTFGKKAKSLLSCSIGKIIQ